jgi:hypothetical protein
MACKDRGSVPAADLTDPIYTGDVADLIDQFLCRSIVQIKEGILYFSL